METPVPTQGIKQPQSVLNQINQLYNLSIKELKAKYLEFWPEDAPASNKAHLIRQIAYKLQEDAFGTLPEAAKTKLETLKTDLNPIQKLGQNPSPQPRKAKPGKHIPLPGTTITKLYKGNSISIKVTPTGFEFNGKEYKSLSRIAKEISGVHQSGFVFFGL